MTAGASIFGTAWAWGIGINRKHAAPVRPKLPFYLTRPYALPPLPPRGGGVGGVCRGRDEPETAAATTRSLATTTTTTSTLRSHVRRTRRISTPTKANQPYGVWTQLVSLPLPTYPSPATLSSCHWRSSGHTSLPIQTYKQKPPGHGQLYALLWTCQLNMGRLEGWSHWSAGPLSSFCHAVTARVAVQ